jgi:hypothetical protein
MALRTRFVVNSLKHVGTLLVAFGVGAPPFVAIAQTAPALPPAPTWIHDPGSKASAPSAAELPAAPRPQTEKPARSPSASVPTTRGKVTSYPLPALAGAPYSTLTQSKHTNMASDGTRIYVSGGDWVHSATDGTWSMSLADGSWRQDVGAPVHPTRPAPHALQDGAGFAWSPQRKKFLLWPGSYFAYEPPGTPILEYAKGLWWFDPSTKTFAQELALFGSPGSSTGSVNGGIYDEVNDQIVAFGDSAKGFATRRWDVGKLVRLPDVNSRIGLGGGLAAYFGNTMHVKAGRYVYILGYRTNGNRSSQTPLFLRWHLDRAVMEELAPPPVDGARIVELEVRLGTSNGKVVWPFTTGPDGTIHGIYVYDPSNDTWALDAQVPSHGNFIGNAVCSLPDGRMCFSGGVFGKQQTHFWCYEAN